MVKRKTFTQSKLRNLKKKDDNQFFSFGDLPIPVLSPVNKKQHQILQLKEAKEVKTLSTHDMTANLPILKQWYQSLNNPLVFWSVLHSHINIPLWHFCLNSSSSDFPVRTFKQRIQVLIAFLEQYLNNVDNKNNKQEYAHFTHLSVREWYKQALEKWVIPNCHESLKPFFVVGSQKYNCVPYHMIFLQFLKSNVGKVHFPISLLVQLPPDLLSIIRPRMHSLTLDNWELLINIEDGSLIEWGFQQNLHYPTTEWRLEQIILKAEFAFEDGNSWAGTTWLRMLVSTTSHCLCRLKPTNLLRAHKAIKKIADLHLAPPDQKEEKERGRRKEEEEKEEEETKEEQVEHRRREVVSKGLPPIEYKNWEPLYYPIAVDLFWMGCRSSTHTQLMKELKRYTFSLVRNALYTEFPREIACCIFNALPQTHIRDHITK